MKSKVIVFPMTVVSLTYVIFLMVYSLFIYNNLYIQSNPANSQYIMTSSVTAFSPIWISMVIAGIWGAIRENAFSPTFRFLMFLLSFGGIIYYLIATVPDLLDLI